MGQTGYSEIQCIGCSRMLRVPSYRRCATFCSKACQTKFMVREGERQKEEALKREMNA